MGAQTPPFSDVPFTLIWGLRLGRRRSNLAMKSILQQRRTKWVFAKAQYTLRIKPSMFAFSLRLHNRNRSERSCAFLWKRLHAEWYIRLGLLVIVA